MKFHKKKYKFAKSKSIKARNLLDEKDRRQKSKINRNERERMKALREKDMDKYIGIVAQSKN